LRQRDPDLVAHHAATTIDGILTLRKAAASAASAGCLCTV
jgi:hypothetical protein